MKVCNLNEITDNSEISLLRKLMICLNYIFAIVGGYRKIASYFTSEIGSGEHETIIFVRLMLYIAIIVITVILAYPLIKDLFEKFTKDWVNDLASIFTIMCMFMMLIIVISKISGIDMNTSLNQVKNEVSFKTDIFYSMFVALIYAPIVEEVVFRGVMYKSIKRNYGGFKAILISSFLFGVMHVMNSFNSFSFSELIYFAIYFIMGIALCISYEYTNSIWGSIINHFIWNFITLIIMFIKIII